MIVILIKDPFRQKYFNILNQTIINESRKSIYFTI